jgi:hypothetical protein
MQALARSRMSGLTADEHLMIENSQFFESNQKYFETTYKHKWVGIHRGTIYAGDSLRQLQMLLDQIPDGQYAYIVQVQ